MSELVVGIGLRAGVDAATIVNAITTVCGDQPIACIATVDRRRGEAELRYAAVELGVAVAFFSTAELAKIAVPNPSVRSQRAIGTSSVAEAAAILGSSGGALTVPRRIVNGVVVAAAIAPGRP